MINLDLEIAYLLRKFLEKNIFILGTKKKETIYVQLREIFIFLKNMKIQFLRLFLIISFL